MNYNDMTVEELLLLNSIDVSKFKKEITFLKLYNLRNELDLYDTYRRDRFIVIGKHKITFDCNLHIEKYSNYLKTLGFSLTEINVRFDEIKAKRKELKGTKFEILDADKIADIYAEDWRYFSSSLAGSCMRNKGDRYHTITSRLSNKDDMKIATLRNSDGVLQARSLVWRDKYYDRVYANDNALCYLMEFKLKEREYMYAGDGYNIIIKLKDSLYGHDMPYMDNVCYYDDEDYTLQTSSAEYELQEVSGRIWNSYRCDCCGNNVDSDDIYTLHNGDSVCESCSSDGVIAYATDREDYYYTEDLFYLEDKRDYVLRDYVYCTDRDCYYSEYYDLYYAEDTGEYYSEDEGLYYAEDTEEYYYDRGNLYFTTDTEIYYSDNNNLYHYNGEYYENKPEGYED